MPWIPKTAPSLRSEYHRSRATSLKLYLLIFIECVNQNKSISIKNQYTESQHKELIKVSDVSIKEILPLLFRRGTLEMIWKC